MENSNSEPNRSPQSQNKWLSLPIVLVGVVVLIILIIVYAYLESPGYKKGHLAKLTGVPENFILTSSATRAPVPDVSNYPLFSFETMAPGLQYQLPIARQEAAKEILQQMQTGGWVAIGGSDTYSNRTVFKVGKGNQVIMIQLTDAANGHTQVSIYKVNHK